MSLVQLYTCALQQLHLLTCVLGWADLACDGRMTSVQRLLETRDLHVCLDPEADVLCLFSLIQPIVCSCTTVQDDGVSMSDLEALLDEFPDQPLDFFGAIRCRAFCQLLQNAIEHETNCVENETSSCSSPLHRSE